MQAPSIIRSLSLLISLLFCISVYADDGAATVKIVVGNAWLESAAGERFAINEGQQIAPGATLVTENGIIQLRFIDGGFMVVQKNTRFRIDKSIGTYTGELTMSEWIKVSDELPENGKDVLLLWSEAEGFTGVVSQGERMGVDGERIWRSCDLTDGLTEEPLPPTHWQPLPCDFVNSPV